MRTKRLIATVAALSGLGALALTASPMRPRCTEVVGRGAIEIPAASIARGAVNFFCYKDPSGERLRFILARDDGGVLHSAVDACEQCGAFHKGYAASKGELVCRYCGNRYKVKDLEQGRASCVPIRLKAAQQNGKIEIKVSDLKKAG
jgi:uncharacterized membrane protein